VVAVAQLYLRIHIKAGLLGIQVAQAVGQAKNRREITSEAGGLIATVATGALLEVAAIAIGSLFCIVWRSLATKRASRRKEDFRHRTDSWTVDE
jgi:hypothetical protein